jgi:hypothetical protein
MLGQVERTVKVFRVSTYNGESFEVRASDKWSFLAALEQRNLRPTNVQKCTEV